MIDIQTKSPAMDHKSDVYKILEFIRDNYDKNELDILEEFIEDTFPADVEKFRNDNYDGPSDGEAWSGGFADNH